jgi:hypothetical protein
MPRIISRCIICGQFFDSKIELKGHKDRDHRITNAKMMSVIVPEIITIKPTANAGADASDAKRHYQEENV